MSENHEITYSLIKVFCDFLGKPSKLDCSKGKEFVGMKGANKGTWASKEKGLCR